MQVQGIAGSFESLPPRFFDSLPVRRSRSTCLAGIYVVQLGHSPLVPKSIRVHEPHAALGRRFPCARTP
jgi:hypothetical protein